MKKTLTESYAKNIEALRKVIVACKQSLMRGRPIGQFPHYWALIPIRPEEQMKHKRTNNKNWD